MSVGGVYDDDMEDLPDFEDPALSELLGGVRATYGARSPVPSPALAVYFEAAAKPHRSVSMRRVLAQLVAATTVVVAATGGLAVAGALPAPVQDAVSNTADNVGVEVPQGDDATAPPDAMDATTTPGDDDAAVDEPTTVADETDDEATDDEATDDDATDDDATDDEGDGATHPDNHGAEVSAVARDKTLHGCEHGRAVSSVASGKVKTKPCPHTDDAAAAPTPEATEAPEPTTAPESAAPTRKPAKSPHGSNGRGHSKHGR